MKISTWNVNGYRAARTKGLADWVAETQPDVLCLQEVKANPSQLAPEQQTFPGYLSLWHPAERPGYSGVATFSRSELPGFELGLSDPRFDSEGRVIQTIFPDFRLFNVYFPNGQRGQERLQYKLDFYAALLDLCDRLHAQGERIIITGDFNTAHRPIDLTNPKQNETTSGFLPVERAWIDRYLEHGFVDAYRHLYPEKVEYSWWTYRFGARGRNVGWRLDYFLVSQDLLPQVTDVSIHCEVLGSDHCPVTLTLQDGG